MAKMHNNELTGVITSLIVYCLNIFIDCLTRTNLFKELSLRCKILINKYNASTESNKCKIFAQYTKQKKEAIVSHGCTLGVRSAEKESGWEKMFIIIAIEY